MCADVDGGLGKNVSVSLPYFSPYRRGGGSSKALDLLSDDVKSIFRIAEFNLDALNTADLRPKRLSA